MTTIKDSVHNHIEVEGAAETLLDTPEIQHLRHIKQLGTVQLIYPSANHTRFERSLGIYYLTPRALSHPSIEGDTATHVETTALFHNVGHGSYSHNIKDVTYRHTDRYHDDVEGLVAHRTVGETPGDEGLDPKRVTALVEGDGEFGQLVSGELDVDRMDCLVRDVHHIGIPYGAIDHERLIRELTFVDGKLVLAEGNVQTAGSLLLARTFMNPTVYQRHIARISKAMLRCASERPFDEDINAEELRRMGDPDLLVTLRLADSTNALTGRLAARGLYKRAVWAGLPNVPGSIIDAEHDVLAAFERDIAAAADVSPESVILDMSLRPSMTESSSRVVVNDEMWQLRHESPLMQTLRAAQEQQWRLGIYTPRKETERIGRAAADVLGLDVDGVLVTEVRSDLNATLDELE